MTEQEVSLIDFIQTIRGNKRLVIGLTLVFVLAGVAYAALGRPAEFTAQGIIRIGQIAETQQDRVMEIKLAAPGSVVSAWSSPQVLLGLTEELELRYIPPTGAWRSPERIRDVFSLEVIPPALPGEKAELVKISVVWRDPDDAAALAEAVGEAIITEHRDTFARIYTIRDDRRKELEGEIASLAETVGVMEKTQRRLEESADTSAPEVLLLQANLEARLRLLSEQRDELNLLRFKLSEILTYPTNFLQRPAPPAEPNPRRRPLIILVSLILGLTVASVAAVVRGALKAGQ